MSKTFNVAVVGATTAIGEALVELLAERKFPVAGFYPLDHEDEAGGRIELNNKQHLINDVADFDFKKSEIVFFVSESSISKKYVPLAVEAGCTVIDRTSVFRSEETTPLVVSGVNAQVIGSSKLIVSPCCITIELAKVLKPIHDSVGIKSINVSTYQAVSGVGKAGLEETGLQTAALLNFKEMKTRVFPHQIAFNVIPQIGAFEESGYTKEEMKIINETKKVLADDAIYIDATTVRVPVFYGHSMSLSVETKQPVTINEVQRLLNDVADVEVTDVDDFNDYPTPVTDAAGQETIYVGRIRKHIGNENGLSLWITADNIRACAASNVLQIAESLI